MPQKRARTKNNKTAHRKVKAGPGHRNKRMPGNGPFLAALAAPLILGQVKKLLKKRK